MQQDIAGERAQIHVALAWLRPVSRLLPQSMVFCLQRDRFSDSRFTKQREGPVLLKLWQCAELLCGISCSLALGVDQKTVVAKINEAVPSRPKPAPWVNRPRAGELGSLRSSLNRVHRGHQQSAWRVWALGSP